MANWIPRWSLGLEKHLVVKYLNLPDRRDKAGVNDSCKRASASGNAKIEEENVAVQKESLLKMYDLPDIKRTYVE